MGKIMERDVDLLLKLIDYCDRIESAKNRFGNNLDSYIRDDDYRDVIKMNLFQMGETVNNLSDEIKDSFIHVPWHQIYGMRNVIAHGYEKVQEQRVWDTIESDIPEFKIAVADILEAFGIDPQL